jgi:uncharacterized protein (UPF0216 family)
MAMEIGKINEVLVRDRKSLAALLLETTPCSFTKKGEPYRFDRSIITPIGQNLPEELHNRLRLPILFFMSPDVPDSCWCMDSTAFDALVLPGEISSLRIREEGKFWVSRAITYAILRRYPTAVQMVVGP